MRRERAFAERARDIVIANAVARKRDLSEVVALFKEYGEALKCTRPHRRGSARGPKQRPGVTPEMQATIRAGWW